MMYSPKQQSYLQLALDQPELTISELPPEILEWSAMVGEPTPFLWEFFCTGHTQWLRMTYGDRVPYPKERIADAVVALWVRACELNTCRILRQPLPNPNNQFFADAELYQRG